MKMICLECGYSFNYEKNRQCPICKNSSDKMMLRPIEINVDELGICDDEEIKMSVKKLLVDKTHSVAYIKLCAKELEENGYLDLALSLEEIAKRKACVETKLLEIYGLREDIRLNLNNILMRAEEDVKHANIISKMAKDKKNDILFNLMKDLAKDEALNLACLNGVLRRYLTDCKEGNFLEKK